MFKFNKKLKSSEKKILYDGGFKIKTNFNNEYVGIFLSTTFFKAKHLTFIVYLFY